MLLIKIYLNILQYIFYILLFNLYIFNEYANHILKDINIYIIIFLNTIYIQRYCSRSSKTYIIKYFDGKYLHLEI